MTRLSASRVLPTAALLIGFSACGVSDPRPAEILGCRSAYADVKAAATAQLAQVGLADAALIVRVDGETQCRLFFGSTAPLTRVPTASAAKWLTAGAILAVVDRGLLRLDTRAVQRFPLAPPTSAQITVAQLLSHTSGLLWFSRCMGRVNYTLQSCAEQILDGDMHFEPGTGFFYAGPPFTVAGAMAEQVMNQSWADLFRITIAEPLRMSNTSYGDSPNPALSEGDVVSTVDDYAHFAQMILDHGVYEGHRVLSQGAIGEMRRNWTAGVSLESSPRGAIPYGLGVWLDEVDGQGIGTVLSSPGIGGFVPVVDFGRRLVVVFAASDDLERIAPAVVAILESVRAAVDRGR